MAKHDLNLNELKQLSESLYFHLGEDQLKRLKIEFSYITHYINLLNKVKTDGLAPTNFIQSTTDHQLRLDFPNTADHPEELFQNAKNKQGKFITTK
ncbi:MAG: hypothetical protein LBC33_00115 [Mycoplasmataceae bacterium]|jgi:aspartyl/glutamyl-tRNA(Asn/Gln) amidotransferase C subunit|nr:hypothetical protein [Mycoplasmataceae bacterium]